MNKLYKRCNFTVTIMGFFPQKKSFKMKVYVSRNDQ